MKTLTKDESVIFINRLQIAFEKQLESKTYGEYIRQISNLQASKMSLAVDRIVKNNRYFPKIADLLQAYREVVHELANKEGQDGLCQSAYGKWLLYRQHRISLMDRDGYRQYVNDPDFRAKMESSWDECWRQMTKGLLESDSNHGAY